MRRERLSELLDDSARLRPSHVAVEELPSGSITYEALAALSDELRDHLAHLGVRAGDRVGICMRKSIDAVAAIFGILKAGAAYVPVDPAAPAPRSAYILADCSVKVVVLERGLADELSAEMDRLGQRPHLLLLDEPGGGLALRAALARISPPENDTQPALGAGGPDDLAYILYTSGSTGKPKGVMLSHRNAMAFVDWCSMAFSPRGDDRFSSHAPLHFDLSIFDLFVSIKHGTTVVLIGSELGKDPVGLAVSIAESRISIWYSTPSVLSLLGQYGKLARHEYPMLRLVLFAGEVFPIKHLRLVKSLLPEPRYWNLYGPTETNVCTYYEIPAEIPAERTEPFPIGEVCSHLRAIVVDGEGKEVASGREGELCISGPAVMQGYWNLPEQTARAFLANHEGGPWYRTGDIVVLGLDGNYTFIGRRDRMVKRRGYRIELGEVEDGLYRHPAIREAAVVASADEEGGVRLTAFVSCQNGQRASMLDLKRHCASALPLSMVPDRYTFVDTLPKTSTDKVDYQRLLEMV